MKRTILFPLLCITLATCTDESLAPVETTIGSDYALGRVIERNSEAPVQTDSLVFHLTGRGSTYSVDIPFTYRNDTGRTVSVVNCQGGLNIGLEKRVADAWRFFYHPVMLMCLSAPIEVAAGETYRGTARVVGSMPGFNRSPSFASWELDGEYRLVWGSLVHDYDPDDPGFGRGVGPLHSNAFLLVQPE